MRSAALVAAALLPGALSQGVIKHVVVVMEENRSFDHMLGNNPALKVDGVDGTESVRDCAAGTTTTTTSTARTATATVRR